MALQSDTDSPMRESYWRVRLRAAVERDGRSLRSISREAKVGENYLSQMLKEGKEPTLDKFIRLCIALDVSPAHVLDGVNMSLEDREFLALFEEMTPDERQAWLTALRARRGSPSERE